MTIRYSSNHSNTILMHFYTNVHVKFMSHACREVSEIHACYTKHASMLQVFAIELVAFAVDFVPLAVEFGTFAVEFVGFAVEFVALAIELDAGLGAFELKFVMAIMTPRN